MSGGVPKRMACCFCGDRILATIAQAKAHNWTLWVGGASCGPCNAPDPIVEALHEGTDKWLRQRFGDAVSPPLRWPRRG